MSDQKACSVGCPNRVRESLLEGCDSSDLPSSNGKIHTPVDGRSKFLAASEWQLIDEAGDKALPHAEVGKTVIFLRIVIVLESLISSAGCSNACGSRLVIHTLGPGINGGSRQVG